MAEINRIKEVLSNEEARRSIFSKSVEEVVRGRNGRVNRVIMEQDMLIRASNIATTLAINRGEKKTKEERKKEDEALIRAAITMITIALDINEDDE